MQAFLTLYNTFKLNGVPYDAIKRILFSFSLRRQAIAWYDAIRGATISTFEELRRNFVTKYFPQAKLDKLMVEIHQFCQFDRESFSDAWERFQDLMKKCPNSMIEDGYKLEVFYNGLIAESKVIVNAIASRSFKKKSVEEVHELLNKIAKNRCSSANKRKLSIKKKAGILEVDTSTNIGA